MNNLYRSIMKTLILSLALSFISLGLYATGQDGEVIYVDGEQWELLGKPVYADSILNRELKAVLPSREERGFVTSNWSGYTAYWSIQQERLCLDSVCYDVYGSETKTVRLSSDLLRRIFKKYVDGKSIVATWFTGDLRLAKGKKIYYVHSGYQRHYESERIVTIDHGKVCGMKDYQNYVVDGFAFDKKIKNNAELREMFPLHLEKYPELAGIKRIVFSVRRARVDDQGHLVECELKVLRPDDNPLLADEMAQAMKSYYPWRVYYINGEYHAYGIDKCSFSYLLDE